MAASPRSWLPASASVALAGGVGVALLAGPALPIAWGVGPAALALVLALALGSAARGPADPDVAGASGPSWRRWLIVTLGVLPAVVVVAVAVRVIAALCVAVPAVVVTLVIVMALAWSLARPRASVAAALAVVVAAAALTAAVVSTRLADADPGARGFAHSGPILGIHPFQSTAIVIDGLGPFDLPINDYVEPDGSRGYGPAALAEALQRDLKAIAEQQFGDGSAAAARGHAAYAGARVEAVMLPAIQERLDRPIEKDAMEPRLLVWSGTTGPRSRVEFVCPGLRNDPRPRGPDQVMDRMCSDKYTSEASAGLGVTGRWTGYTEGRGAWRLSLARALGWSRGSEAEAAATGLWETRLWAWIALLLASPMIVWPGGARGLARAAAGLCVAALAVFMGMFFWTWPQEQVGMLARASPWATPWRPSTWAPALAIAALASLGRRVVIVPAVLVGLGTWALAGSLAATLWAGPIADSPEAVMMGLAGVLVQWWGVDLAAAEAIAGSVVVAAMLGVLAAVLGPGLQVAGALVRPGRPGAGRWVGVGIVVAAGLLVLSRKTLGGAALLSPALALLLVASSGLAAGRGGARGPRIALHALVVGLALWAASDAWELRSNGFMAAALLVGSLVALASVALLVGPRAVRSPVEGASGPPQA